MYCLITIFIGHCIILAGASNRTPAGAVQGLRCSLFIHILYARALEFYR